MPREPEITVPLLERALIRIASWMAPPAYRGEWRREWLAELAFARGRERRSLATLWRACWSWVDAVALWRREVSMEGWANDVVVALRKAVRSPGLTVVVTLTLAVGIGAGSAIFSIVDSVLWRDLELPNPEALVRFSQERPEGGQVGWGYSYVMYRTLAAQVGTVDLAGYSGSWFDVTHDDGPIRVAAARVTDTFFPTLELPLSRGRSFTREEEAAGRNLVVVSHEFWRDVLGEDPDVLDRSLPLGGVTYEIIGVTAPRDRLLAELNRVGGTPFGQTNLYLPLEPFGALQAELTSTIQLVGRLRPGVDVEQARSEVFRIQDAFLRERGATGWETHAVSVKEYLVRDSRPALLVLFGAVGVLLAMVCANLGSLVLVRGTARSYEWATRRALGAGGLHIGRQLLTEGGVLAVIGTVAGLAGSVVLVGLVARHAPTALPRSGDLTVDGHAILFSLLVATVATAVFAVLPSLSSRQTLSAGALASNRLTMSRGARRTLKGLVALQVGMSVVLLTGSGVLLRSLAKLMGQDTGYDVRGVVQAVVDLPQDQYPTDAEVARYAREVTERLRGLPGAETVSVGSTTIPTRGPRIRFQKVDVPGDEGLGGAMQVAVSREYFDVMRIAMSEGRAFSPSDVDHQEVAVITPALARRYWPNGDAVGKRISIGSWRTFGTDGTSTPPVVREIVGVTVDVAGSGIDPGPQAEMLFAPMQQDPWRTQFFLVRGSGSRRALADAVRQAIAEVDPGRAVYDVRLLIEDVRDAIDREWVTTVVVMGFALSALLLSGLGIYGVVAYSVTRRRREIGVRLALGAEAGVVMRLIAREGLAPVIVGAAGGFLTAVLAVRSLTGFLYQMEPLDPIAFLGAACVLVSAALVSVYVPARRSTRVDPVEVIRAE